MILSMVLKIAVAMIFLLLSAIPQALAQCVNSFEINYFGLWSEPYNACNREMRTTFSWNGKAIGGYLAVWCQVYNTPFSREYTVSECPGNEGNIVAWTHCSNLEGHRLIMDVQPFIHYDPGFTGDCKFRADYFAKQEQ